MSYRFLGWIGLLSLGALGGAMTMSWTHGQSGSPPAKLPPEILQRLPEASSGNPGTVRPVSIPPANPTATTPTPPTTTKPRVVAPFDRFRNRDALPEVIKPIVHSTQIGLEWLYRYNQPDGRFLHGYIPALNQALDGDHGLRQAMAAYTLCRAARFTADERYIARASQAVLTLLADTMVEDGTPPMRVPAQRSVVCNRLAMAGFLVMAIAELPDAAPELVTKSEELCMFIRSRYRENGSLHYTDTLSENPLKADPEGVHLYPGPALYGLMLSQRTKPATWKTELARRALPYYRAVFKQQPSIDVVSWMSAFCAEAYITTREACFAEFIFEMTDWVCGLQYTEVTDPKKIRWNGGFMGFQNGKPVQTPPTIHSAACSICLAEACRLIRNMQQPDTARYDRYRAAAIQSLQFFGNHLQFNEGNTLHIASNYRMMLVGGFHPSMQDGTLRIDQSALGVLAFIDFLSSGADR